LKRTRLGGERPFLLKTIHHHSEGVHFRVYSRNLAAHASGYPGRPSIPSYLDRTSGLFREEIDRLREQAIQNASTRTVAGLDIFVGARREIALATTPEAVRRILAWATTLAAAAKAMTDKEVEAEAAVLRYEAERRLGVIMQMQKRTVGLNEGAADPKPGYPKTRFPNRRPWPKPASIRT
jgi:hypothetical protein